MKGQINIDTLHAFIVRDDDGTEGLVGMQTPGGWMPMVAADADRVASLEKIAHQIATATGKTISLVHFTKRDEVRTIEPNRTHSGAKAVRVDPDKSEFGFYGDIPPPDIIP